MGANARRLPRACIVRDTHLYVIYLPNLPMPFCRRSLGLWARRSSLSLSLSLHFSGFLTPFFYLLSSTSFFPILFFLFLSLFFYKVDGWLDFLADVGRHMGRRILETIGIFLQSCKTRSIFDRRESREVANNRGDFRSQIPLCHRGASAERIGRGAIN